MPSTRSSKVVVIACAAVLGLVPSTLTAQDRCSRRDFEVMNCGFAFSVETGVPDFFLLEPAASVYVGHSRLCSMRNPAVLRRMRHSGSSTARLTRLLVWLAHLEAADPRRYHREMVFLLRRGERIASTARSE